MASGTISLNKSSTTSDGYWLEGKIEWSSTANNDANTSSVIADIYVKKNANVALTQSTTGTWEYSLTINGSTSSGTKSISVLENWVLIGSKTVSSIAHNTDGSKSISISGYVNGPSGTNYAGKKTSGSDTVKLDTIPRASTITSASAVTLGNACSIKWTPASTKFYYRLRFIYNTDDDNPIYVTPKDSPIHPNTTSVYTYTGYTMSISDWAPKIPAAPSGTCTVYLYTYSDSSCDTKVGDRQSKTFKFTLPSSVKPKISSFKGTIVDGLTSGSNTYYVQGKSKCKLTMEFTPGTGSTMKSYSMTGQNLSGASGSTSSATSYTATTAVLSKSGTLYYSATATDKRDRKYYINSDYNSSSRVSIYVYPYAAPTVKITAKRTSTSGSVKVTYNATYSSINGANELGELKIYRKLSTSSTWSSTPVATIALGTTTSGNTIITECDSTNSYDFKATIVDTAYSSSGASAIVSVSTEFRLVNIKSDGTGIAFGKLAEKSNTFDCNLPTRLSSETTTQAAGGIHISNSSEKYFTITRKGVIDDINQDGTNDTVDVRMQSYVDATGNATCRRRYSTDNGANYTTQGFWELGDSRMYVSYPIYINGTFTNSGNIETNCDIVCTEDYDGSNFAIICKWADGENHDLLVRNNDGLTAAVGSYVNSTHSSNTRLDLRGGTVRTVNASGATTVSDERLKTDWKDLNKYSEFYDNIKPKSFKYINGSSGRNHIGFSAQQIEQSLIRSGLSTSDFAGLVKYKVDPSSEEYNGYDEEYGLIYSEFIALNTYMIQKLQDEIKSLKAENSILKDALMSVEGKIDQLLKTNEN